MVKSKMVPRNWEIGDTFALKINNEKYPEYNDRYFIFIKVGTYPWGKCGIPIFRVKITENNILPIEKKEIDELEYVQTSITLWEDRFKPLDGRYTYEELVKERSKVKFYPDEFGYLKEYLIALDMNTSKKVPEGFMYLGNFDLAEPHDEYIPFHVFNIPQRSSLCIHEELLRRYLEYNKRHSEIYDIEYAKEARKEAQTFIDLYNWLSNDVKEHPEKYTFEHEKGIGALTYVGGNPELEKLNKRGRKSKK